MTGAQRYNSVVGLTLFYGHVRPLSQRANSLQLRNVRFTRSRETTSPDGQRSDPVDLAESYLRTGADTALLLMLKLGAGEAGAVSVPRSY